MEGKESSEGGIVYREAPSDPLNKGVADVRDGGQKISNDGCTSE